MKKDIRGKVKELYDELTRAKNVTRDIIGSLEVCDANTNLKDQIGLYARQMPEFKILAEKRVAAVSIIRQVCTGEMTTDKALKLFHEAKEDLEDAISCIKL